MRAQQLRDYDYVRVLTRPQVAWEYLRRNEDYRRDWLVSAPGRPRPIRLTDGTLLLQVRRRFLRAEDWGLCTFADPDKTALETDVFWRAHNNERVLSAYIRGSNDSGLGSVVSLKNVRCRKTLLRGIDGEQHILLSDRQRVAQVRCIGEAIRLDPFMLELVVDRFPDVDGRQRHIRQFADIYRNKRTASGDSEWTVEATRHRDALAALDRRSDGSTYRQIAVFLYGREAVETNWKNPDQTMKNRVIRSVKRGLRMTNGAYRQLLA